MNIFDIIILSAVLLSALAAICHALRNRKKGCCGNCNDCVRCTYSGDGKHT